MEFDANPKSSARSKTTGQESDRKDGFFVSCLGRLRLMKLISWTRRKSSRTTRRGGGGGGSASSCRPLRPATSVAASLDCKSIADSLSVVQPRPVAGGFKYDPLSYSQNFDEGSWLDHDPEAFQRNFSSRYAAPNLATPQRPHPPPPTRSLIDE